MLYQLDQRNFLDYATKKLHRPGRPLSNLEGMSELVQLMVRSLSPLRLRKGK